ncbi:carboxypeptidase regulatory-like domain-containing protein [Fulvivirga ligni]|uniref:carboxypeptidase regulatory-like domain-containing protein n=1 Tax=Fulvivirga ligni TaxID=2904246 RepID=UPI001F2134C5|nr:carboxypeptidase regulatory-like domain-containing protein [Fulvivirga ligni]UII20191.1 carboxypeptidase regulatory-like domain-containing protein [Fulvivirga ligni]
MICCHTPAQVTQGLQGTVYWSEGNMMPGPEKSVQGKKGVEREIYIYKAVKSTDTEREGQLFSAVNSDLAGKIKTDDKGKFVISLPPGKYSVFTKEEDGLFASIFDGEGYINPVVVKSNEVTEITIDINYKAAY